MRDIDVFLAGGERYLAIARGTSSLLYKFVGDKTDVTFKLESVFPGSEKIIHFRNEFGSILMTISGNKTNTYVYTDGLFAKMTIMVSFLHLSYGDACKKTIAHNLSYQD